MPTVRDVLFDLMRELKMTKIFGNIGSTEETMLKNFPSDFQYLLALQESVAVAMADAYSQATGEPVHVNLHTAAGSGNAMGNIETAWYNRTPMIITAGQQTREMLLLEPYLSNKNPLLQAAPWVKWSYGAMSQSAPKTFRGHFFAPMRWRFKRLLVPSIFPYRWTTWIRNVRCYRQSAESNGDSQPEKTYSARLPMLSPPQTPLP
jgi:hypothetical protein